MRPVETFVSSLDFSEEDGGESVGMDFSAPTPTGTSTPTLPSVVGFTGALPLGATTTAAAATAAGANGGKQRNTVPTLPRANARASKTAALTALTAMSTEKAGKRSDRSSSTGSPAPMSTSNKAIAAFDDVPVAPSSKRNPTRKVSANVPRAPPLDFNTIRTEVPRYPNPPARPTGRPRIFGLDHAPVYHPTIEEFASPMEYIEKIALEAKDAGICKIVPPEGWRPPFALDTETFRFKTRLQQLNSMEASARASLNFLEQLYIFHRQQGSSGIAIPTVAGRPLDLWKLKREVNNLGGYTKVTNGRKWTTIARTIGYDVKISPVICSQIKHAYSKIIVPFEEYVKRVELAGGVAPPDPSILHDSPQAKANPSTPQPSNGAETLPTPVTENDGPPRTRRRVGELDEKVRTASDKLNEALNFNGDTRTAHPQGSGLLPSPTRDARASATNEPGEVCEICTMDHDPDLIVLCDGCDRGYHTSCLSPPLAEVPESQFFCVACLLLNGADYGFEEGQDHSFHSFRRRADAFKRKWLAEHPVPSRKGKERQANADGVVIKNEEGDDQLAVEDHIEREFWRLVESPHESVEVEYGADLNHTVDGGGMPNLELHPDNPYSKDGWNLNNLPILSGSLLRYIKSDISGMTIPWIYVGMVFSTFAWHKEDHYTYSINYHHWGETKTWYGIPGGDDEKLEAAMKQAAPELFAQQPDLMFQLVTLMSPGRLKKHGVRIVACDQRPNEFVITFPRAYHSGFNHGFNCNEAVNFALPDWLPTGLKCVNRYRDISKNPVFSHDELLLTISQHERSPRSSRWLYPNWKEMVDRELAAREQIRRVLPGTPEWVDTNEIEEEHYQCGECRTLAYLSQAISDDGQTVSCLDHFSSLPGTVASIRLQFSDDELRTMLAKVKSRSDKAGRVSSEYLVGNVPHPDLGRTTGRKRKPSAAALEAAGEDAMPTVTQKPKVEHRHLSPASKNGTESPQSLSAADAGLPSSYRSPPRAGFVPPLSAPLARVSAVSHDWERLHPSFVSQQPSYDHRTSSTDVQTYPGMIQDVAPDRVPHQAHAEPHGQGQAHTSHALAPINPWGPQPAVPVISRPEASPAPSLVTNGGLLHQEPHA